MDEADKKARELSDLDVTEGDVPDWDGKTFYKHG